MSDSEIAAAAQSGPTPAGWRAELLVLFLFIVLTAQATRPVLTRLDWVLAGQDTDVLVNQWADWWTQKALSDPDLALWQTSYIFYPYNAPEGVSLTYHSFSHLNTLISLSLRPLLGAVPAYNLTILFNFVLNGFAMYQLGRYLTGSRSAGILAGIVFAFNSHSQYQSAHPVLHSIWCIPWATRYFWQAWAENSRRHAVIAAVFVFLSATVSTLLFIMLGLWLAVLALYFWRRDRRPNLSISAITAGLGALFSLPLLWPLLTAFIAGRDSSFLIGGEEYLYITDLISPLFPHWYFWLVRGLYIGLAPLLLIVVARYRWRQAKLWYAVVLVTYLFAIGPQPQFLGRELDITLPWTWLIVPLLRNPYRLNILFGLGLALLVANGWLAMAAASFKTRRSRAISALVFGALIFGEYTAPLFPLTVPEVSPFYTEFLATAPHSGAIADIPINSSLGKRDMYFQTFHGRPIVGGRISRPPADYADFITASALLRAAATDLGPAPLPADAGPALANLRENNIDYLVLHKADLADELGAWQTLLGTAPVYEDEWVVVYGTE